MIFHWVQYFSPILRFQTNVYNYYFPQELEVRPGRTQVGAVTFSDNPRVRFPLNTHQYANAAVQVGLILYLSVSYTQMLYFA